MGFLDYAGLSRFKGKLDEVFNNFKDKVESEEMEDADVHMGLYRDADGDLCEI